MLKIKTFLFIAFILLLCGCENKKCIKSHKEQSICTTTMCIPSGRTVICYPIAKPCTITKCDEYEKVDEE